MSFSNSPSIAIVVRTKNEERWIRHCLIQVFSQSYLSFSVVIVDNQSTDSTVEIAKTFPVHSIHYIDEYMPGKALNIGIASIKADYYVFLSAHCIPNGLNWLSSLLSCIQQNNSIAGAYGRQIALPSSEEIDKRDLLMTFRVESRITSKDSFFHNANSIVRGDYIRKNLFDDSIPNAEDHIWGRSVIDRGLKLAYSAEAEVFHHHGLHQGSRKSRVSGVLSQLESSIMGNQPYFAPDTLTVKHNLFRCILLIPTDNEINISQSLKGLYSIFSRVLPFFDICIVSKEVDAFFLPDFIPKNKIIVVDRGDIGKPSSSVNEMLVNLKSIADESLGFVDTYLYFNLKSSQISGENLQFLVYSHLANNNDITSFGESCYDDIWIEVDGEYQQVGIDAGKERSFRVPMFKVLRGYGTAYNSSVLSDQLHNAKNCIIPLS